MKNWIIFFQIAYLLYFPIADIEGQNLPQVKPGTKVRYSVHGFQGSVFQWEVSGGAIRKNYNDSVDVVWGKMKGIHTIKVTQHTVTGCTAEPVYGHVFVTEPSLNLEDSVTICEGQIYTLKITENYESVKWSTGSQKSFIKVSQPGYYKVEVYFANGDTIRDSTLVEVLPNPVFSLGKDLVVCNDPVVLDPKYVAESYQWSNGEISPTITVKESGIFWVKLTNYNGCSFADTIQISPCGPKELKEQIPNAFTPNGDNDNDTWKIEILAKYPDARVLIYNRWGQLVYKAETNYPTEGWDGISNGVLLPMDTYFYVIDFKNGSGPKTGAVNLIK